MSSLLSEFSVLFKDVPGKTDCVPQCRFSGSSATSLASMVSTNGLVKFDAANTGLKSTYL